ncbi:MAG: Holliday junction resolvase RuvX [Chloroflexi bacterium]|jgi:putative Holliday junction resolvase|nr:Holliday junction resolvase RuvX [Anaerolineaceae bacterium]NLI43917.1 Holliday junction resolvase RuvX [Chloroflexota bacterium]HOE35569.1 Holliday junction resolvase RuvX [Anaerolineaceae bacterium]HOT24945.1 Holliday junction resolvase RuvX [Anaerolineaceae bacterium]HQH57538.1 Holliday junction resolvase RuvX [Anaerolineaceae bacterium]
MTKALAVDPGELRIGIAISDETGTLARPLTILKHTSRVEDAINIAKLAQEHGTQTVVVGVALNSDGEAGPKARSAMRLMEAIRSVFSGVVVPWDESHSSRKAAEIRITAGVKRKKRADPIDDLAAAVILQEYLDAQMTNREKL